MLARRRSWPRWNKDCESQLRNIEATYGRSIDDWIEAFRGQRTDPTRRNRGDAEDRLGLSHGAANRVALVALDAFQPKVDGKPPGSTDVAKASLCRSTPG